MLDFEFDLQRFDDDGAQDTSAEPTAAESSEDKEPIPEELNGIPEDIARETMAEWKATQAESEGEPAQTGRQPGAVPYDRFKEKVDEANQLKAQLAQYQRQFGQQQQVQQPPPQPQVQQQQQPPFQAPQIPQPQMKITPEIAKQINLAIEEEARAMTDFTKEEVEDMRFVDEDDPKLAQWNQAKAFATGKVMGAIRQLQAAQQQQAQQFINNHVAAVRRYNAYVQQAMTDPEYQNIQNYAANEFFSSLSPEEKSVLALSYLRADKNIASPAELIVVQNYFEKAKAAYRSRNRGGRRQTQTRQQNPPLPRTDQVTGTVTTGDGQLSERDIERLLETDFTTIDPKVQKIMLGLS